MPSENRPNSMFDDKEIVSFAGEIGIRILSHKILEFLICISFRTINYDIFKDVF